MLLEGHVDVILKIQRGLGVILLRLKVDDEVVLDRKHGVDIKMGVVAGVDLVDDGGVVGVSDHEVDVGRTHGRTVHQVQQHTGGPVGGQRVGRGMVAVPPELALLVGAELPAQVVLGLIGVLEVVLAVG